LLLQNKLWLTDQRSGRDENFDPDDEFDERLEVNGLASHECTADGTCMYSSIGHQLLMSEGTAQPTLEQSVHRGVVVKTDILDALASATVVVSSHRVVHCMQC
jgi:hypothetical protein